MTCRPCIEGRYSVDMTRASRARFRRNSARMHGVDAPSWQIVSRAAHARHTRLVPAGHLAHTEGHTLDWTRETSAVKDQRAWEKWERVKLREFQLWPAHK
jgi:hypothetical protein